MSNEEVMNALYPRIVIKDFLTELAHVLEQATGQPVEMHEGGRVWSNVVLNIYTLYEKEGRLDQAVAKVKDLIPLGLR